MEQGINLTPLGKSKVTKRGVAYDLPHSPYRVYVDGTIYHFSSSGHRDKFTELMFENRCTFSYTLRKRFGYPVEANVLADLTLYHRVETRGFCISFVDGGFVTCQRDLILSGLNVASRR